MHINNGKTYSFLHRFFLSSIRKNEFKQVQFKLSSWLSRLDSNVKVLDIGCGDGIYLNLFDSDNLYGCDITQSNRKNMPPKANFLHSDFLKLSPSHTFDIICFFGVLEFYEDKSIFFEKARNLLNDKGVMILMSPFISNDHSLYSKFSIIFSQKTIYPLALDELPKDINIISDSFIFPHNNLLLVSFSKK